MAVQPGGAGVVRGGGRRPGTWAGVYEWFTKSRQGWGRATPEATLMPFDAPFMLGPFAVDAMGRLAPNGPAAFPGFFFRWRGRAIPAKFEHTDPPRGRLVLQARLGRIPSTANPRDSGLRPQSFQLLNLLPRAL